MKKVLLIMFAFLLAGCGAPNPPMPYGQRQPVNEVQKKTTEEGHLIFHNDPDDVVYQGS